MVGRDVHDQVRTPNVSVPKRRIWVVNVGKAGRKSASFPARLDSTRWS